MNQTCQKRMPFQIEQLTNSGWLYVTCMNTEREANDYIAKIVKQFVGLTHAPTFRAVLGARPASEVSKGVEGIKPTGIRFREFL